MEGKNKFPLITLSIISISVCCQGIHWDWVCGNGHEQEDPYILREYTLIWEKKYKCGLPALQQYLI